MGNSVSLCQEQSPTEVPVADVLKGESTEAQGAEATNDAGKI